MTITGGDTDTIESRTRHRRSMLLECWWLWLVNEKVVYRAGERIVAIAGHIAKVMENQAYLILDAFFAVGPVFKVAA